MIYFMFCFSIIFGPVRREDCPGRVAAARVLALLEGEARAPVLRSDPEVDFVPVAFQEKEGLISSGKLKAVLKDHGIVTRRAVSKEGKVVVVASFSRAAAGDAKTRVKVYTPHHRKTEQIVRSVKAAQNTAGFRIRPDRRTGKIIVAARGREMLEKALKLCRNFDRASPRESKYHSYRCQGVVARVAHEKLIQLLPRDVRRRVRIVPYRRVNTLLAACGSDDWDLVLGVLRRIDPEGEVLDCER